MSYESPVEQRSMVLDDYRNGFYRRALEQVIGPESVVMDLGSGLGILGFIAASLGAKKVLLVESVTNQEAARQIAAENGLEDKVEFITIAAEKLYSDVKVDVITSVFTGNFLLEEDLLPLLFLARDRFLKPGGSLIPDRASMVVAPISMSSFYDSHINSWVDGSQGIKHGSMLPFAQNSLYFESFNDANFTLLAEPRKIRSLDFHTATTADCHEQVSFHIRNEAQIDGFLCWFDARLGGAWLSTSPNAPKTHWSQVYMPVNRMKLVAQETVSIEIDRAEFGEWHWRCSTSKESQQYSTFLAVPTTLAELRRRSEFSSPTLSDSGRAAKFVLTRFGETATVSEIAAELSKDFSALFVDEVAVIRFIQGIAERFGE